MVRTLRKPLVRFGLYFDDPNDERSFFIETFTAHKPIIQISFFAGGVLYYVFFIWDKIIDPTSYAYTQAIRGLLVTPIVWICAGLLQLRNLEKYYEIIIITPPIVGSLVLALIFCILRNGFDFGAVGEVLIILFCVGTLPVRTPIFTCYCLIAWASFDLFELITQNESPGMFIVNNLSLGKHRTMSA